ncbi:DUF4231 domain-containing protein [Streptomyces sp. ICN988]|uniref:DUF4231 domain-containing protein n=1 Tax=Streptomyces sp. ICN988 TaxID=2983765 RepID=UPI0021E4438B|nr:DUF4231 domain-containing protein [Streptomyces sp. ICN988]MCV2458372.1 DUF4231 domain-containing protein [Streptomyces sp. ICN988]
MAQPEHVLLAEDLPAVQRSADAASMAGQRSYLWWTRCRLYFVVGAAAVGTLSATADQGSGGRQLFIILSLIFFLLAFATEIVLLSSRPEEAWYHGRAVAESAKTLAWKFAVGAAPFPRSLSMEEAERILNQQLSDIVAESPLLADYSSTGTEQISEKMKALRVDELHKRKEAYLVGRIDDQRLWYSRNSKRNEKKSFEWRCVLLTLEVLGASAALLLLVDVTSIEFGSVLAACVAAGGAWIEVKQYDNLASAYALTATELTLVHSAAAQVSGEADWSTYVSSAEQAISREHTMWLARRMRTRLPRGNRS